MAVYDASCWFMTYKYNDKVYEFALNGQTGKLAGTPPLEKKLKLFCIGECAAVTAIGSFIWEVRE